MPAEQELTASEAVTFLSPVASQAVGAGLKEPTLTDNVVVQSEVAVVAGDYDNARSQSPNVVHDTSNLSLSPNSGSVNLPPAPHSTNQNLSLPPNAVVETPNLSYAADCDLGLYLKLR